MKKFKCKVFREEEYIIEFDERVIDQEWMKNFRDRFYNFHDLSDHAKHIAACRSKFGQSFIDGYGIPLENAMKPLLADDEDINQGINIIKIIDDHCEVEVREINEEI